MRWRLIVDAGPRPGVENMAVDRALLESVKAGGPPSLRFYRWDPPCLSLGRNQPALPALAEAAGRRGIDVVRRPTGGAAVLHDQEITYSIAVPVGLLGSPRETYRSLNRALVAGLRRLGVEAAVAGDSAPAVGASGANESGRARAWTGPCFVDAAPGEVIVDGRKLVGSAQRREGRVLLQHGSLLLGGDQSVVAELMAEATGAARVAGTAEVAGTAGAARTAVRALDSMPEVATLEAVLGSAPAWDALVDALTAGFAAVVGTALAPGELSREEVARARELEAELGGDAWIWRR